MPLSGRFARDANHVPVVVDGVVTTATLTLNGNNTTVNAPIFHVTGSVEIRGLWGQVTTDLGANCTAAFWRLNDQTAQPAITAAGGTTISAVKSGSVIVKKGLAAAALTLLDNAAGRVSEPTTLETTYFSPFVVLKKTAATTDIEFNYTTTDTPTSGVIQFYARWLPISADANLIAAST